MKDEIQQQVVDAFQTLSSKPQVLEKVIPLIKEKIDPDLSIDVHANEVIHDLAPSPRRKWRCHFDAMMQDAPSVLGHFEPLSPTRKPPRIHRDDLFSEAFTSTDLKGAPLAIESPKQDCASEITQDDCSPPISPHSASFKNLGLSCLSDTSNTMKQWKSNTSFGHRIEELPLSEYEICYNPPFPPKVPDYSLSRSDASAYDEYQQIAVGLLGRRFSAVRMLDGLSVSIKCIEISLSERSINHFLHEMYAVICSSRHENIVHVYDCWVEHDSANSLRISQELIEEYCDIKKFFKEEVSGEDAKNIALQLFKAIRHVHYHGIIHGNISQEHIHVSRDVHTETPRLKLGDFLVSRKYACPSFLGAYKQELNHKQLTPSTYDVFMGLSVMIETLSEFEARYSDLLHFLHEKQNSIGDLTLQEIIKELSSMTMVPDDIEDEIAFMELNEKLEVKYANSTALHILKLQSTNVCGKCLNGFFSSPIDRSSLQNFVQINSNKEVDCIVSFLSESVVILKDLSFNASLKYFHRLREERAVIAEYIGIPLVSINTKSIITEFNKNAGALFGYLPGTVIGKKVEILMTPDIARHHSKFVSESNVRGSFESTVLDSTRDVLCKHKNGNVFCTKMHVRFITNYMPCSPRGGVISSPRGGGSFTAYFVGVVMTAARSNCGTIPSHITSLMAIFNSAIPKLYCFIISEFDKIIELSQRCQEFLGFETDEIVGKSLLKIIPEVCVSNKTYILNQISNFSNLLKVSCDNVCRAKVLRKGERVVEMELRIVDSDPTLRTSVCGHRLYVGVLTPL